MANLFQRFFSHDAGVEIEAAARLSVLDGVAVMSISGDWLLSKPRTPATRIEKSLTAGIAKLTFDTKSLGAYDSALVCMLFKIYQTCQQMGIVFDDNSLPEGPRELLRLAVAVPEANAAKKNSGKSNILGKVGIRALDVLGAFEDQSRFIGEISIASIKAAFGRARYRLVDLLTIIQKTGPEALPIVALISFLVGLILAFVGAIQLAKYGSEIFVADLVGIAMVREMGAIMVGIVMSGRTGASFAAELGSMKVNEEISAFRTFGISPIEFLVFPRIIALVMMFPLLTIFANVIGMLGGMVIGVGMFDISYEQYANRTLAALDLIQISTGVGKSFIFGIIVACIGCKMGLQCEKSSAGVGQATTSSVVQSITWIIVADAIFAVIFTIFDI
ncbi:putative uncharacterized protein [Coraliomargarita sp. CAG:312]|nr:putative uncharacterized protein [Coraliomargarita sp. CAG:312]